MSFLSSVTGAATTPNLPQASAKPTGGFLSGVTMPTAAGASRAGTVQRVSAASQVSKANSDYANSFKGLATNTVKGLWNASGIPEQWEAGQQQIDQPFVDKGNGEKQTPLTAARGALSVGSGVATKIFSPLAPVFNPLSKGINAIGEAYSNSPAIQKFSNTPEGIATAKGAGIVADVANVAGAVVGGAESFKPRVKGGFLEHALADKPEVSAEVPRETPPAVPKAEKPLAQTHAEYAKSQGYEPYTPHDQLPTIQMGKSESKLPTVQTEAPATRPVRGDLKYEPVKSPTTPRAGMPPVKVMAESAKPEIPYSAEKVDTPGYKPLTPTESTGPERTSTLASKVKANAIAKEMDADNWETPGYNQVDMKEQNTFAADFVANEPEKAMRVAMGEELPPNHIIPEKVFEAVEKKATLEGDAETIRKLTNESNMSTQATAMGQRIRALGDRDQFSPVRSLREVSDTRENSPAAVKVTKTIRSQGTAVARVIKESAPTKDAWASFVKDISCNY